MFFAQKKGLIHERPDGFLKKVTRVNRDFHEMILQANASPRLQTMTRTLYDVERVTGSMFLYSEESLQRRLLHHQDITQAFEQGDGDLAHDLVRRPACLSIRC